MNGNLTTPATQHRFTHKGTPISSPIHSPWKSTTWISPAWCGQSATVCSCSWSPLSSSSMKLIRSPETTLTFSYLFLVFGHQAPSVIECLQMLFNAAVVLLRGSIVSMKCLSIRRGKYEINLRQSTLARKDIGTDIASTCFLNMEIFINAFGPLTNNYDWHSTRQCVNCYSIHTCSSLSLYRVSWFLVVSEKLCMMRWVN